MQTLSPSRLALAAVLAWTALAAPAGAATLAEALDAYRNNRVTEAETMLGALVADPATAAHDRAAALRELGRIDGLIRGETDAMAAAMAQTSGEEACATATTALRIYREVGQPATPLPYAEASRGQCTPGASDMLRVQLASTHMALADNDPSARAAHLARADAELDAISPIAAGAPDIAKARLTLAMMRADSAAAFDAWRAYFWLTDTDAPQALTAYAGRARAIFDAGLAANASDADRIALVNMLIRAGFTDDARAFSEATQLAARNASDPNWVRAAAYFRFHASVREITTRTNHAMVNRNDDSTRSDDVRQYSEDIRGAMMQLMTDAGLSGDPQAALGEAYGLFGSLGETSGYPSLHGGHIVEDRRIVAEQYGRRGELRFVVVDNMVSNGFESWLWDGWAEAGGWADDDATIVQIRSAYTAGPLSALRRVRPGPTRERFLQMIARFDADERSALGRDGVASLPATSERLEMEGYEQIARRTGDDDAAFIAEVWRATYQYSIEKHEGRHAIDKLRGTFSSPELEYMAKLSQIALSDYPRLGLASIAGSTLGDTPHGIANRRILTGYRNWMRRHWRDIPGFDRNAPALSQLTLLSDAQIVAIAQSMDDLARSARR
jgi:hypothetical protein